MHYFSGFCFQEEFELFDFWLKKNDYTVAGFSYGAIKAVEYALNSKNRVDRVILLSPAFFNDKDNKYKKMQLLYFAKNRQTYIDNFLQNVTRNSNIDLSKYSKEGTKEELKELLYYEWSLEKMELLKSRGITVEVILGEKDLIINSQKAKEFFEKISLVYWLKNANHLLENNL